MPVFEGEDDWPLPKSAGMMMKYFCGLNSLSSPISQVLSEITAFISRCYLRNKRVQHLHPENHVGYTMAGSFGSPKVLKATWALGMISPLCNSQSPSGNVANSWLSAISYVEIRYSNSAVSKRSLTPR